jgi:tRNA (cmo5U34)-methyltransferase
MDGNDRKEPNAWTEETARLFIDYGKYFVPEREAQMQVFAGLLSHLNSVIDVLELCCGEGLLAETLLERFPALHLRGLDGSDGMLEHARQRLARFGDRFESGSFDLAAIDWRSGVPGYDAVVSSLAIHHLTGEQKLELFRDVRRMLRPGGVFIIADIVAIEGEMAKNQAADAWDAIVQKRSLELDGNTKAFGFFREEGWNMYRYFDPQDIDRPSSLMDQLKWMEQASFVEVEVHWLLAGHAIFSGMKNA